MQVQEQSCGPGGRVYLLVISGELRDAQHFVAQEFPGCDCVVLIKRELREAGWAGQLRALRKLKGEALVFFVRSFADLQEPQLTVASGLLHRCKQTLITDSEGRIQQYGRVGWLRILPKLMISAVADLIVFALARCRLQYLRMRSRSTARPSRPDLDLCFIYPNPLDTALAGGALSHVEGFLSGLAACHASCEVFSGRPLPAANFRQHVIAGRRRYYIFREALMLAYNAHFLRHVCRQLKGRTVGAIYQRHGRFMFAGVLLSRWLRVPLVLEYNGSETWMSDYWDPARFASWLNLCEEVSIRQAHTIVVVSEASKAELLDRGIAEETILLNPNGVDPSKFRPGCGGEQIREKLGWSSTDVVAAFVGSFSYWHGIQPLVRAIQDLLDDPSAHQLRFLLVGEGPLYAEARNAIEAKAGGRVCFTGIVPHAQVPAYLDAADLLLSPHVPMPDGKPFFGSPTKLFEYMSMGKAIVASNLDQLGKVLEHGRSAWLVEPGNPGELASAIALLARTPELRKRLGENSRVAAVDRHTWRQNAASVLDEIGRLGTQTPLNSPAPPKTVSAPMLDERNSVGS